MQFIFEYQKRLGRQLDNEEVKLHCEIRERQAIRPVLLVTCSFSILRISNSGLIRFHAVRRYFDEMQDAKSRREVKLNDLDHASHALDDCSNDVDPRQTALPSCQLQDDRYVIGTLSLQER